MQPVSFITVLDVLSIWKGGLQLLVSA